jgi:hypothetical protein|tara:strand:- start:76 stop:237 length:162 start_codon:yes stop_codon:yes gene_type:complete
MTIFLKSLFSSLSKEFQGIRFFSDEEPGKNQDDPLFSLFLSFNEASVPTSGVF